MDITDFRAFLAGHTADQVYDRCILTGSCSAISDDATHTVRDNVAQKFGVEFANVVIVGSANLGFSIKPKKRYESFGEDSDIDVALVCSALFEHVWKEIFLFEKSGAFWPEKRDFRRYLSKGWIRPDKLPSSPVFGFSNEWWEFFRNIKVSGVPFKISGGIYHSHFFLREYQKICIEQCKVEARWTHRHQIDD